MLHSIHSEQLLKTDRRKVWDFISSPHNLAKITPPHMGFEVLGQAPEATYAGQIIEYKVSPLLGIKLHWVTEITHVKEGFYFVDEQRFGPYTFWHHQHLLEDVPGGTLMKDIVHYKAPLGALGKLANRMFIKRQLSQIFSYRHQAVEELFNSAGV